MYKKFAGSRTSSSSNATYTASGNGGNSGNGGSLSGSASILVPPSTGSTVDVADGVEATVTATVKFELGGKGEAEDKQPPALCDINQSNGDINTSDTESCRSNVWEELAKLLNTCLVDVVATTVGLISRICLLL